MQLSFVLGWGFGTITKTDFMGFHGIFLILVAVGQHFVSEGFVDDR